MNIFNNKPTYILILLFMSISAIAQPPDPGAGTGVVGTGAQSSPIDMYVIVLAVVGVFFAFYFAKRYAKQVAK